MKEEEDHLVKNEAEDQLVEIDTGIKDQQAKTDQEAENELEDRVDQTVTIRISTKGDEEMIKHGIFKENCVLYSFFFLSNSNHPT